MNKLKFFLNESLDSILSNGIMTIVSIGTITISMFIFSFFISFFMNTNYIVDALEQQVEISVYINDEVNEKEINNIKNIISSDNRVKDVKFISKDDAFENLKNRLMEENDNNDDNNIQNIKIDNPLSNSFQVSVKDTTDIQLVTDEIKDLNGVDEATYGREFIEKIFNINKLIHLISLSLITILFLATTFIISNTTKISVHARKDEIEIMKYIGAKDSLIIIPFIIEGMILGAIGGFISSVIFRIVYTVFTNKFYDLISFVNIIPVFPFITYISLFIIVIGIIIGGLGSYISVKKYINV